MASVTVALCSLRICFCAFLAKCLLLVGLKLRNRIPVRRRHNSSLQTRRESETLRSGRETEIDIDVDESFDAERIAIILSLLFFLLGLLLLLFLLMLLLTTWLFISRRRLLRDTGVVLLFDVTDFKKLTGKCRRGGDG